MVAGEERVVHLRFDGTTHRVPMDVLDVGDLSDDSRIKDAIAGHLGIALTKLSGYTVTRETTGHFTVAPPAVFGGAEVAEDEDIDLDDGDYDEDDEEDYDEGDYDEDEDDDEDFD